MREPWERVVVHVYSRGATFHYAMTEVIMGLVLHVEMHGGRGLFHRSKSSRTCGPSSCEVWTPKVKGYGREIDPPLTCADQQVWGGRLWLGPPQGSDIVTPPSVSTQSSVVTAGGGGGRSASFPHPPWATICACSKGSDSPFIRTSSIWYPMSIENIFHTIHY